MAQESNKPSGSSSVSGAESGGRSRKAFLGALAAYVAWLAFLLILVILGR